jgi:hypothetical protein
MAKSLNSLGVRDYLNEVYAAQGGYDRLIDLVYIRKWPRQQVANEFKFSREHLRQIINRIEEERNAGA